MAECRATTEYFQALQDSNPFSRVQVFFDLFVLIEKYLKVGMPRIRREFIVERKQLNLLFLKINSFSQFFKILFLKIIFYYKIFLKDEYTEKVVAGANGGGRHWYPKIMNNGKYFMVDEDRKWKFSIIYNKCSITKRMLSKVGINCIKLGFVLRKSCTGTFKKKPIKVSGVYLRSMT